jgi:hypothetical protein
MSEPDEGPDSGPEAGMTLIEMIVVLGLMALIVVFMANGMGAVRSFSGLGPRIEQQDEMTAVRDHLRRTIAEAFGRSLLRREVRFTGAADSMRFLAPSDPVFEIGGLYRIALSVAESPNGRRALVEERSLDREDRTATTTPVVLLDHVESLTLRYRIARSGTRVTSIGEGDPLPDLIELSLRFPDGDNRSWSPLLIDLPNVAR